MAEGRMNLAALQQRDPYITDIVDTASQVALYSFSKDIVSWEKTDIEGSLFVYKRSASPTHGFMILNRLGLTNQIDPITKDMEFDLQEPFLLYRTNKGIYGVWFYDNKECVRIGQMVKSFLQEAIKVHTQKAALRNRRASESDSSLSVMAAGKSVNILQMLSKAQDEYDKSKKKPDPKPLIDNPNASAMKSSDLLRPQPLKAKSGETDDDKNQNSRPASGPLSLETLFRNASLQQSQEKLSNLPSDNRLRSQTSVVDTSQPPPTFHRSLSVSDTSQTSQDSQDVPALLKHIMSSGSMVEDIERQHRAEFPPSVLSSSVPNEGVLKLLSNSGDMTNQKENNSSQLKDSKWFLSESDSKDKLGDSLSINRLSDSAIRGVSPCDNFGATRQTQSCIGRVGSAELLTPAALEKSVSSEKINSSRLSTAAAALNPDVLLSPMAFVRGSQKSPASSISDEPGRLNRSNDSGSSTEGSTGLPVAALTKEQLQQAIIHLMKTDPSFINTLHEAYLQSLKELSKS